MTKKRKISGIEETIRTVLFALVLAGIIRTLLFQPFWIPSGSMKSTLLIGDFLFVNKMAYGYSRYSCPFSLCPFSGRIFARDPKIGDIVVFKHPTKNVDYIKRLIGLPGDTVQMIDGVLYLNGKAVKLEHRGFFSEVFAPQGSMVNYPQCKKNRVSQGGKCEKDMYNETLPNGASYTILNIREQNTDNTPRFTVPAGHYFFMGDNRDNSIDSRFGSPYGIGFVPFENFIGRARYVVFSSAGNHIIAFWTWRHDRYFKRLD